MKKALVIAMLVAVVIGGILLIKNRKAQLAGATPARVLPVVVDKVLLSARPMVLTLPAMGVVNSELSSNLSTKVTGRVTHVYKKAGDPVAAGDILARIDDRDLKAKKRRLVLKQQGLDFQIASQKEEARALETGLAAARESHARTAQLLQIKGASVEQFRQEEAGLAQLTAKMSAVTNGIANLKKSKQGLSQNIQEIEALISYTVIASPGSGTVSDVAISAGDLATPGKVLFHIAVSTGLYLNLSLPDGLAAGQIEFKGQRLDLSPKNQATASGLVQYVTPLPDGIGVVEGQYVNVRVIVYAGENVLVPVDGLLTANGTSAVFVLSDGKAVRTPVHISARGTEGVVVSENLNGQTIVTAKPDILLRLVTGAPPVVR